MDREGRRVAWLANLTGQKQEAVLERRSSNSILSSCSTNGTSVDTAPSRGVKARTLRPSSFCLTPLLACGSTIPESFHSLRPDWYKLRSVMEKV